MSGKANKTLIGAFVLGSMALLLLAVAIIGSGNLFSKPLRFVMFFESSLKGLSPGSPVVFRGVPVGRVAAIRMSGDVDTMEFFIPVYIELDRGMMQDVKHTLDVDNDTTPYLHSMIERGLRGRLNNQSLLTGQLLIEIDFFPGGSRLGGFQPVPMFDSRPVIPTIPSQFDTVWQRLSELPIDSLVQDLISILRKIDDVLQDPRIKNLPTSLDNALLEATLAMQGMDETLVSIRKLADSLGSAAAMIDKETPDTLQRVRRLVDTYTGLASQLDRSLESVRGVVGPNTAAVLEFTRAVREIGETARAIRSFAGTLERNPESLLLGKGNDRKGAAHK